MIGKRAALFTGLALSLLMIGASVGYLIPDINSDGGAVVNEELLTHFRRGS